MSFKLGKLAFAISVVCSVSSPLIAQPISDMRAALSLTKLENKFAQASYIINLKQGGALTKATINDQKKRVSILNNINIEQERLITELTALDSDIEVLWQSRLIGNFIKVKATGSAIEKIKNNKSVKSVVLAIQTIAKSKLDNEVSILASGKYPSKPQSDIKPPFLIDDTTAGLGVKVAIIGSGVDYTHKMLGGEGTFQAYAEALNNGTNQFGGFPTDVVVEGFDFSSDIGIGFDPNPIDQAMEYKDVNGWSYDNGHGTRLASIVHSLAPGAKLAAYKTSNVADISGEGPQVSPESSENFIMAIELAIDPNQDGSFDDRADVIVVDGFGGNAFFMPEDGDASSITNEILVIEMASAVGALVVVNAGEGGAWYDNKFNMAWRAAAPSALTVGAITVDSDTNMKVRDDMPHGPVRGADYYSKPDMVTYAENVNVATLATGEDSHSYTRNNNGAARIAAAAAIIKSKRSELSMQQVKAILMNTANNNVFDYNGEKIADLTLIGNGIEDLDAALSSPVLINESQTLQPNLSFGFVESQVEHSFVKTLQFRNTSDKALTYLLSHSSLEKTNNKALNFSYPDSVTVAANSVSMLDVTMNIDFSKLNSWEMNKGTTLNAQKWSQIELNGHFTFTAEDLPTLNVGWMVKPRQGGDILKNFETYEMMTSAIEKHSYFDGFADAAYHDYYTDAASTPVVQTFTNNSSVSRTFATFPIIAKGQWSDGKAKTMGHKLETMAGGIYDEALCTVSGKKLSVAVRYETPSDAGMANHFDRATAAQMWFSVYERELAEFNEWDKVVTQDPRTLATDSQIVINGALETDEDGQAYSIYTDYNIPFDENNPTKRYTKGKLPAQITGHGKNVIVNYCLEELYHHDFQTAEAFNDRLAWIFATDRDAQADLGKPMIMYNPTKYGPVDVDTYFDWMTGKEVTRDFNWGGMTGMATATNDGSRAETYSHIHTAQPGEEVEVMAMTACADSDMSGAVACKNPGVLMMSLNDNWGLSAPIGFGQLSVEPNVKPQQEFTVTEGILTGTVVGQVRLDHLGFFAAMQEGRLPFEFIMAGAVEGDAFTVTKAGEIIVNNADSLDFESGISEFIVSVYTQHKDQGVTEIVPITIMLKNINDEAPVLMSELNDITITVNDAVEVNIAEVFTEVEGDVLVYSAQGLPEGVEIDTKIGFISGTAIDSGEYEIIVAADDGIYQTTTSFNLIVNAVAVAKPEPKDDSSGSLGALLLSVTGIGALLRRRRYKTK
jgi:hypothetical protein